MFSLETTKILNNVTVPFSFPAAVFESSSCSTSLTALDMVSHFKLDIPISMQWYFILILICIFLMTTDVDNLFMWLFTISVSSLVILFNSFAISFWAVFFFYFSKLLIFRLFMFCISYWAFFFFSNYCMLYFFICSINSYWVLGFFICSM